MLSVGLGTMARAATHGSHMPYRLFHAFFPELAERETRKMIVPPGATKVALPVGEYALVEMFCDERGCDCRRVFLYVQASFRPGPEGVIAWGWEPRAFYERWSGEDDEVLLDSLKGPALNLGSPETDLAQPLLEHGLSPSLRECPRGHLTWG